MEFFFSFLPNLIPLYILIGIGFLLGKYQDFDVKHLANFLVMVANPIVAFGAMAILPLKASYIFLPILVFVLCCVIGLLSFGLGKIILKDQRANLLGLSGGTGSTGYYGLPIAMIFLNDAGVALYILMATVTLLFEATLGYYLGSLSKASIRGSLKEMIKIPVFYAMALGLAFNLLGVQLPDFAITLWDMFKMALIVLGMAIVGVGMARLKWGKVKYNFVISALFVRHLIWPILVSGLIFLDQSIFHFYPKDVHLMLFIIGIVPLAANIVSYAARLDLRLRLAAMAVFLSNLVALGLVPLYLSLFF